MIHIFKYRNHLPEEPVKTLGSSSMSFGWICRRNEEEAGKLIGCLPVRGLKLEHGLKTKFIKFLTLSILLLTFTLFRIFTPAAGNAN